MQIGCPSLLSVLLLSYVSQKPEFFCKPTKSMYSSYLKTFFSAHFLHALPSAQNFFSTASPQSKKFNSPFKTSFDPLLGPEKKSLAASSVFLLHRRGDTLLRPSYMSFLLFSLSSLSMYFFSIDHNRPTFTFLSPNSMGEMYVCQSSEPRYYLHPPVGVEAALCDQKHCFCSKMYEYSR